jgi:hypothetical protein
MKLVVVLHPSYRVSSSSPILAEDLDSFLSILFFSDQTILAELFKVAYSYGEIPLFLPVADFPLEVETTDGAVLRHVLRSGCPLPAATGALG